MKAPIRILRPGHSPTAYRSMCLVPVIEIVGAPGTAEIVPTNFRA